VLSSLADIVANVKPPKKSGFSLKDLSNFGNALTESANNFRWPTEDDLKQLNLLEPLKLKEVRTKGPQNGDLTAIQLVFQNGIESPLFDAKHSLATAITSVKVRDEPVKKICC